MLFNITFFTSVDSPSFAAWKEGNEKMKAIAATKFKFYFLKEPVLKSVMFSFSSV